MRNQTRLLRYAFKIPAMRRKLRQSGDDEPLRIRAVHLAYRAATTRYRLAKMAHHTTVYVTSGNPAMTPGGTLDAQVPDTSVHHVDLTHENLVVDPESVVHITSGIIRAANGT